MTENTIQKEYSKGTLFIILILIIYGSSALISGVAGFMQVGPWIPSGIAGILVGIFFALIFAISIYGLITKKSWGTQAAIILVVLSLTLAAVNLIAGLLNPNKFVSLYQESFLEFINYEEIAAETGTTTTELQETAEQFTIEYAESINTFIRMLLILGTFIIFSINTPILIYLNKQRKQK